MWSESKQNLMHTLREGMECGWNYFICQLTKYIIIYRRLRSLLHDDHILLTLCCLEIC